jgi:hypothetical protein
LVFIFWDTSWVSFALAIVKNRSRRRLAQFQLGAQLVEYCIVLFKPAVTDSHLFSNG